MRFSNILCAIDFSEDSREAMRTAMSIAGPDSRVTLVNVYTIPIIGPPEMPMDPAMVDTIIRSSEDGMREWKAEAASLGKAPVEGVVLDGIAWDAIVNLARERRADLIVMGTHGRTGLRHALIGSVAERVLRHASCPVLIVRAPRA